MNLNIKNYPGAKSVSGWKQQFLNILPKADVYVDLFGGSGAVTKMINEHFSGLHEYIYYNEIDYKTWMDVSIELDNTINFFQYETLNEDYKKCYLEIIQDRSHEDFPDPKVIYCDPPYLMETRKSQKEIYKYDWNKYYHHLDFIKWVSEQDEFSNNYFIISHYPCEMYDRLVDERGWNKIEFEVATRGGTATEALYFNFDTVNTELLTYKYLGKDNTDRQRIKRKQNNILNRIKNLPPQELKAIKRRIENEIR